MFLLHFNDMKSNEDTVSIISFRVEPLGNDFRYSCFKSTYTVYYFFKVFFLYLYIPIAANCKDVCLQNKSKSHSFHLKIWHLL